MIRIESNGSKWAGQEPDDIETLLRVLAETPLRPDFEEFGNFAYPLDAPECWDDPAMAAQHPGQVRFFGNFAGVSHGFQIDTDEADLIQRLTAAIRANQASPAYQRIRAGYPACPQCGRRFTPCRCEPAAAGANI